MTHPVNVPGSFEEIRRKRARRTAWIVAAVAVAVYVGFILSGVLAS